jgi:hypothetical protein
VDTTIGLSHDLNYAKTVSKILDLLTDLKEQVQKGETFDAIARLEFAIQCFEGDAEL